MPSEQADRNSTDWRSSLREAGPYLGLGMQLAATLVTFTLGGYFLDRQMGTLPWFTISGSVVGLLLLFLQIYKTAQDISRRSNQRKARGGGTGETP